MIPIYTRVLTTADYGIIETISRLIDVIGLFLSLGLAEAMLRFYYEVRTEEERRRLVSTAVTINLLACAVGLLIFLPLAPQMSALAFGRADFASYVRLAMAGMLIGSFVELPFTLFRAEGKPWRYTMLSILKLCTHLTWNIVLVVWLRWGVWGVIWSGFLSASMWSLMLGGSLLWRTGLRPNRLFAFAMLRYGLPLVPASISQFVLHFSDRFFLAHYATQAELGLYALAYRFGMLVSTFYGVVSLSWAPWAFQLGSSDDAAHHLRRATALILLGFACVSAGIALLSAPVIRLMSAPAFWKSADYVPPLTLAYWLFVARGPLSVGAQLAKRTDLLAVANAISAAVCLGLSVLWIPRYGAWGAVWTTVASFAVLGVGTTIASQRVYAVRHDGWSVGLALFIAAVPIAYHYRIHLTGWTDLATRLVLAGVLSVTSVVWLQRREIIRLPLKQIASRWLPLPAGGRR